MPPVETIEALFPSSAACGNITLLPMTPAHASAMEAMGVDLSTAIDWDHILIAAWVLATPSAEIRKVMAEGNAPAHFDVWCGENNPDPYKVIDGVERIVSAAFRAFVPPAKDETEKNATVVWGEDEKRGFGWTLEIAEALSHEYGMTLDDALDIPLCRAYALMNCARKRSGGKFGGPDYYERIKSDGVAEMFRKMRQEAKDRGE